MKLLYSQTSPFVRKVMVLAHETGLVDRLELVPVNVAPVTPNDLVAAENPLVKVPTLVPDDGESLFDSAVIVEYLDSLHGGTPLVPRAGAARWSALQRQAAADGLLDAAVLVRYELVLRPEEKRWPDWIGGQMRKIRGTLDSFEADAATLGRETTIGEIAVACALAYLDFRYPEENWRAGRPGLAAFYARFADRPSMQATLPPA
ncbi:MAG: glutathione S-transferase N-terminal domain-containing protein [Aliidongia sp.]